MFLRFSKHETNFNQKNQPVFMAAPVWVFFALEKMGGL